MLTQRALCLVSSLVLCIELESEHLVGKPHDFWYLSRLTHLTTRNHIDQKRKAGCLSTLPGWKLGMCRRVADGNAVGHGIWGRRACLNDTH